MTETISQEAAASARQAPSRDIGEFLASRGGPFYRLQTQLRLLHENSLRAGQRAVLFVVLAWGVPFLLGLPRSFSLDRGQGAYLADLSVWSKFFIGIGAFVLAEQQVEIGLRAKLRQLVFAPIVAPTSIARAASIVTLALRRRDLWAAEFICLILAIVASVLSYENFQTLPASSWAVEHLPEGNRITVAGWWSICFSLPLFVFLFTRGVWRHLVWAQLLRGIARLDLRLVANHPDGKAGLGFLARYPNTYVLFVFGMSCAIAAQLAKHFINQEVSATTLSVVMAGWLIVVLAFFAYPLSAFTPPLTRLKENGLMVLGAQATRFYRLAERKTIGRNVMANQAPEPDGEIADPSKLYDANAKLSTVLISRAAVVPVAAAALIPFAIAALTKLPYKEVFSVLKKLLLL
ncbi:hypothetical protein OE766_11245 [Pararhizobium sp. YC-54]|uniref:hypothetical protein n=1 Tax=Pararhizobium sp. YC-54 TaxID=2986920 RepID=UPI0021F752BC|nr:hypothetical protein [Pararhizobium sp. YC-54]MCV9998826.1 hypothetical protein [Pararhizobium sp. YC-54]